MTPTIDYVYCVGTAANGRAMPDGIDGARVRQVGSDGADGLRALVSSLDAREYAAEVVSERTGDSAWLAPRARAHDALVTWAADAGPTLPFPMWVLFADERAIVQMLHDRADEFRRALAHVAGAREYGVRVAGDRASVEAVAERTSVAHAELVSRAADSTPGQAYLLQRKMAELRKAASRDAAARLAEEAHRALSSHSRASVAPAGALAREQGVILDGAYLVDDGAYDAFRATLTEIMREYQPSGIRFDFTGPWPPYHFVRDA
ncbi:MAG: GvpL/GvpF family gas vesicle protein [Gemmatimonadota bacterium]|nr:GvpL/GvpF family gas vesicle protein [Gemmatimonadota bacterium]